MTAEGLRKVLSADQQTANALTLGEVIKAGKKGLTEEEAGALIKKLHGSSSCALSVLHADDLVVCLTEKRPNSNGNDEHVYVAKKFRGRRPVVDRRPQTSTAQKKRDEIKTRALLALGTLAGGKTVVDADVFAKEVRANKPKPAKISTDPKSRIQQAYDAVCLQGQKGMTWPELDATPHIGGGHGSVSALLSNLDAAKKIVRLEEERGSNCNVYVKNDPAFIAGRPVKPRRKQPNNASAAGTKVTNEILGVIRKESDGGRLRVLPAALKIGAL